MCLHTFTVSTSAQRSLPIQIICALNTNFLWVLQADSGVYYNRVFLIHDLAFSFAGAPVSDYYFISLVVLFRRFLIISVLVVGSSCLLIEWQALCRTGARNQTIFQVARSHFLDGVQSELSMSFSWLLCLPLQLSSDGAQTSSISIRIDVIVCARQIPPNAIFQLLRIARIPLSLRAEAVFILAMSNKSKWLWMIYEASTCPLVYANCEYNQLHLF